MPRTHDAWDRGTSLHVSVWNPRVPRGLLKENGLVIEWDTHRVRGLILPAEAQRGGPALQSPWRGGTRGATWARAAAAGGGGGASTSPRGGPPPSLADSAGAFAGTAGH